MEKLTGVFCGRRLPLARSTIDFSLAISKKCAHTCNSPGQVVEQLDDNRDA
jgi:hypothetical protein